MDYKPVFSIISQDILKLGKKNIRKAPLTIHDLLPSQIVKTKILTPTPKAELPPQESNVVKDPIEPCEEPLLLKHCLTGRGQRPLGIARSIYSQ